MVAMVLGLALVLVATTAYLQSAGSTRFASQQARMNEEASLALELLIAQIRLAGFSGVLADGRRVFRHQAIVGCDGGFTPGTGSQGFDALRCNNTTASDALAVRYEATPLNSQTTRADHPTNRNAPLNCAGEGIVQAPVNGVMAYLADNRFYVANDNTNNGTPSLHCNGSAGGVNMSGATALVPNVEALQIRFALTQAVVAGAPIPHQITALVDPSHPQLSVPGGDWPRVAGIDICIVVRSDSPVARDGLSMNELTRHVDCTGAAQVSPDGRLRRAYRTTLSLPNLRPALPLPYEVNGANALFPYRHL
jgi:type IV pilus assembly protein PilW